MVNDTFPLTIKLSNNIDRIPRSNQAIKPKTYKATNKTSEHISVSTQGSDK